MKQLAAAAISELEEKLAVREAELEQVRRVGAMMIAGAHQLGRRGAILQNTPTPREPALRE